MKAALRVFAAAAVLTIGAIGVAQADDPMKSKEASPTLKERIMEDAVKGTVLSQDGNTIRIRDEDGKEVKLHIDSSTKMDKVMAGDRVKAYHTDQGHVTTLERIKRD
jgi:translation initiation factor IF-1